MPCVPVFCNRSGLGPALVLSGGLPLTLALSPEGRGDGLEAALGYALTRVMSWRIALREQGLGVPLAPTGSVLPSSVGAALFSSSSVQAVSRARQR